MKRYADAAILIAGSRKHKFHQTAQKFNMKVSIYKTKSLVISKEPQFKKQIINRTSEISGNRQRNK